MQRVLWTRSMSTISRQSFDREAIRLYREILRTARVFTIPHPTIPNSTWGQVLAKSARSEFDASKKDEPSTTLITQRIITAQDALTQIHDKLAEMQGQDPSQVKGGKGAAGGAGMQ